MRMMSMLSLAAVAFGLFATAASPSVAQGQAPGQPGASTTVSANEQRGSPYMIMIFADGTIMQMPVTAAMTGDAMKSSKALTAPIMITVANGKAYTTTDTKLADGTMLSATLMNHFKQMHERN